MFFNSLFNFGKHTYTFASIGLHTPEKEFSSRKLANEYMYKLCLKKGLRIINVYDDKHDKTYICQNGVRFFINRI